MAVQRLIDRSRAPHAPATPLPVDMPVQYGTKGLSSLYLKYRKRKKYFIVRVFLISTAVWSAAAAYCTFHSLDFWRYSVINATIPLAFVLAMVTSFFAKRWSAARVFGGQEVLICFFDVADGYARLCGGHRVADTIKKTLVSASRCERVSTEDRIFVIERLGAWAVSQMSTDDVTKQFDRLVQHATDSKGT